MRSFRFFFKLIHLLFYGTLIYSCNDTKSFYKLYGEVDSLYFLDVKSKILASNNLSIDTIGEISKIFSNEGAYVIEFEIPLKKKIPVNTKFFIDKSADLGVGKDVLAYIGNSKIYFQEGDSVFLKEKNLNKKNYDSLYLDVKKAIDNDNK